MVPALNFNIINATAVLGASDRKAIDNGSNDDDNDYSVALAPKTVNTEPSNEPGYMDDDV